MTPFRPDRSRRGPDTMLGHRMLVFVLGAVVGAAGIATDRQWLIYVAIGILVIGLALRFLARRDEDPPVP
ncbi:hypothetical protein BH23GEM9_BH23GEM9_36660 [soil metagenome]